MGIPFERQELGSEVVTDGWNILARIPGRSGKNPFLFVFHLDTAAPSNQVEVCVEGGCIRSKGSSVLGADGKLAIAVVMEAVERLMQEGEINRPIELFVYRVPGAGAPRSKICGLFQDRERGGNCHRPLRDRGGIDTHTCQALYECGTDWARRPCYPQ